ncbi:MAG: amidase [Acidobacteria bacterium]|nr:amidase [Acidobacteriota bacterium]
MLMLRQFVEWLESGEKTPQQLMALCLERIREAEPELQTWVEVSPQPALAEGPLNGIPFGVKDIFETENLATGYGSPLYAGRKGGRDAALVRGLRGRGAIVLGKTQTTAFAYFDPAPTRNPRDPRHTPGGSSSGSAAAVAAGMVPFALGTQTLGSVLRPASFCGVTGFKPTYDLLSLEGVLPFATSLDTAGLFTETAADMKALWERMGHAVGQSEGARLGAPADLPEMAPEMERAFWSNVARLRAEGFPVEPVELPSRFWKLLPAAQTVCDYEGARTHQERWREHGLRIGLKLGELVMRGQKIPPEEYAAALDAIAAIRQEMAKLFQEIPVILTPATTGPAPAGLESTGDPRMNTPWTALGTPAISIPMPVDSRLPLGLQLAAAPRQDGLLVEVAALVEALL